MPTAQHSSTGVIFGTVRDAAGHAVPDVAVLIASGNGPHHDIAAVTGNDGRYELPDLPPGTYTVQANATRGGATGSGRVEPGGRTRVDLHLI